MAYEELTKKMDKLIPTIDENFSKYKLLGNFDYTEDEYADLLEYVGVLSNSLINNGNSFEDKYYKLIFTTLVEITKRWKESVREEGIEENSRFWDYISKCLINKNTIHIDSKLYHAFTEVISQLEKRHSIPIGLEGTKYYSTLMMHSFSPKDSIFSFYDLCYNIFKKDLDFGFTNDDEWICKETAVQIKCILGGSSYGENKKVSIGSSVYSIKTGLRSFSQNEDLYPNFVKFIKDTFDRINKLFNRELIDGNTRLERYIVEWWKNKTESEKTPDNTVRKKRIPIVSKENIIAKFIRDEDTVFLFIPPIRLEDEMSIVSLDIFVNKECISSERINTKRGELVVTTKQINLNLNDLLKDCDTIGLRVEIKEKDKILFDSERSKATILNREFILFEGEKEISSQINKSSNYFVYSKDIDALKVISDKGFLPFGENLYNIYPKAGGSLSGSKREVFFVDKTETTSIGKDVCLIGERQDVEWFYDDISCTVYSSGVKLLVPENANLKALELRIDKTAHKLKDLDFERIESGCYQFGLKVLSLIPENYPTEIELYSYEKSSVVLSKIIIVLPNLKIQFNYPFYYDDLERTLTVYNGDKVIKETSWSDRDDEIKCPINDEMLLIKITYLNWRINKKEWHNEPLNGKLWYKDILENGDTLEIDYHQDNDEIKLFGRANGELFEIDKNSSGKFEIGRAIYFNEEIKDIEVFITYRKNSYKVFNLSTKEYFITNPLSYVDGKVFWNVEDAFVGDKENVFFLIIKSKDNDYRHEITNKNCEIEKLYEDICKVKIKIKDKNIFSKETYDSIYEGDLSIGSSEALRFKHKWIELLSANCFDSMQYEWIHFSSRYIICDLEMVQEDDDIYYSGKMYEIDSNDEMRYLDFMGNEKGTYDKINPIRIELRDNRTLWMVAGWEGGSDFLGDFFCDKWSKKICNIQKQDNQFGEIKLYKFKEEGNV